MIFGGFQCSVHFIEKSMINYIKWYVSITSAAAVLFLHSEFECHAEWINEHHQHVAAQMRCFLSVFCRTGSSCSSSNSSIVWQTAHAGSISSKFWPTTVCVPFNCARHQWWLPVNSDICGIFCLVLFKLFLKEFTDLLLTTSLGRALQVVVILIWVKALGNWRCRVVDYAIC